MSTRASTGRDSNVQKYYNLISKNQIKRISALGRKKNRDAEGLFVAETPKVIREFLKQGWKPTALYTTQPEFWSSEEREEISERDLQKISFLKNAHEALAVFSIPEHTIISYEGLTLVLDAVRDPGNLGTIIRLCDWFGVKNILASPDTADCYNPKVVQAAHNQLDILIHAMGDAFADPTRIELLDLLQKKTGFERGILGCSGSDSVEAALKTARIATGRTKVLAFGRSYHGLAFGSLPATNYKTESFKTPFLSWLGTHVEHCDFGGQLPENLHDFAGVIVEPIQGRGGIRVAPPHWLRDLIDLANRDGAMVIFDEIYTGFGRTGQWFAFEHEDLEGRRPDLICLGKAMGGGFPISVCMGTAEAMDSWGASKGEAIHTQTFLGNPLGCAMALASLRELEIIIPTVQEKGQWLTQKLQEMGYVVQGRGLLLGIQHSNSLALSRYLLHHGFIALPAGIHAEVLAITPPLVISKEELQSFLTCLEGFPNT